MKNRRQYREFTAPDPRDPKLGFREMIWNKTRVKLKVACLIPEKLYVYADEKPDKVGNKILRRGEILSRNLELTRRNKFDPDNYEQQNFVRFFNIYEAIRGISLVQGRTEAVEIKEVETWNDGLMTLILMVGDMFQDGADEFVEDFFHGLALDLVAEREWLRDLDKIKAREKTLGLTLTDTKGRFNPGRLPLRALAAQGDLTKRKCRTRQVGLKMNVRAVVLADYLDEVLRVRESIELAVARTLKDERIFGARPKIFFVREKVRKMIEFAERLDNIHVRPFLWSFQHAVKDLTKAAKYLLVGDYQLAEVFLERISASMQLLSIRRRMKQVLTVVSRAKHLKHAISDSGWQAAYESVAQVRNQVVALDSDSRSRFTVLPFVNAHVHGALGCIAKSNSDDKVEKVYQELKKACKAI